LAKSKDTVVEGDKGKTKEKSAFVRFFIKFWDKNNKSIMSIIYTLAAVGLFLGIWQILCVKNILKEPQIFAPSIIFERIWLMITTGEIFFYSLASLSRMTISFTIAALLGVGLGLLMGWSEKIYDFFDPLLTFFMPIPGIAWAPLVFIWVGFEPIFSRWGIIDSSGWWWNYGLANPILIIIGIIAGVFPIIQNISIATQATDKKLIWAAKTMGASNTELFRKVLLPNSLPYLFTGFKLGLARCWRTIIATEFMSAAATGLGFYIFYSQSLQTSKTIVDIYAGIFTIAFIFYVIELLIKLIEKQTIEKWGMVRSEGGTIA